MSHLLQQRKGSNETIVQQATPHINFGNVCNVPQCSMETFWSTDLRGLFVYLPWSIECSLVRDADFSQEFMQFLKHGHCKLVTGSHIIWYNLQLVSIQMQTFFNSWCTVECGICSSCAATEVKLCGQRSHICFWLFLQTALGSLHLSCIKNFQPFITVYTKHVSVVLMMASCDTLFWNVFATLYPTSSWKTTPCTVPSRTGSCRLSWWFTQWNVLL